jgi:hypothetical protein
MTPFLRLGRNVVLVVRENADFHGSQFLSLSLRCDCVALYFQNCVIHIFLLMLTSVSVTARLARVYFQIPIFVCFSRKLAFFVLLKNKHGRLIRHVPPPSYSF